MISIPKHIKFNDIELNDFWNDDTIYDYIVSHIKNNHKNNNYLCIEDKTNQYIKIEFDIYTKIYKKSSLLSFFTYKKIDRIYIKKMYPVSTDNELRINYFDLQGNRINITHIILNMDGLVYSGSVIYKKKN